MKEILLTILIMISLAPTGFILALIGLEIYHKMIKGDTDRVFPPKPIDVLICEIDEFYTNEEATYGDKNGIIN